MIPAINDLHIGFPFVRWALQKDVSDGHIHSITKDGYAVSVALTSDDIE